MNNNSLSQCTVSIASMKVYDTSVSKSTRFSAIVLNLVCASRFKGLPSGSLLLQSRSTSASLVKRTREDAEGAEGRDGL